MVQTGPKSQLGGLKTGFSSPANQVVTDLAVKIDPMKPAASGITRLTANLTPSLTVIDFTSTHLCLYGRLS
jgi:hypothetical protein